MSYEGKILRHRCDEGLLPEQRDGRGKMNGGAFWDFPPAAVRPLRRGVASQDYLFTGVEPDVLVHFAQVKRAGQPASVARVRGAGRARLQRNQFAHQRAADLISELRESINQIIA